MKVYLAGPMTGIPEHNYPAFLAAEEVLVKAGFEVVNPARLNGDETDWHKCLRVDVKAMLDCEGLVLLPGWARSRGASFEYDIARTLEMVILPYAQAAFYLKSRKAGVEIPEVGRDVS